MGEHSGEKRSEGEIEEAHHWYLHQVIMPSKHEVKSSIVHSYKNVINGFSAFLRPDQAAIIAGMEGVISVFPVKTLKLHTTRSWDFVHLLETKAKANPNLHQSSTTPNLLQGAAGMGGDVIVGVIDTGVWPESLSFRDEGMGPVPASWKGACEVGAAFNTTSCNRKIIGARYHVKGVEAQFGALNKTLDFRSPRDIDGHGTHTSSTILGQRVAGASAYGGFGSGTATGGALQARLAVYKACWTVSSGGEVASGVCLEDDILAAFDAAIGDGVHVISVSLGGANEKGYFTEDSIAIGALHAAKRNIAVVCSGGNDGPDPETVANVAPWILTVAASSTDRLFSAPLVLGNGVTVKGESITPVGKLGNTALPLVYAGDVEIPGSTNSSLSGFCMPNTLTPEKVKGKAVFCLKGYTDQSLEVKRAGGAAAVLGFPVAQPLLGTMLLPATTVYYPNTTDVILKYIKTDKKPVVKLIPGTTEFGTKPSPTMAYFSSLGPSNVEPNILKPDITAPGLNILAAWSEATSPTELPEDPRRVKYNIISGTSMSCPHVSGAVALLKAIHPQWSAAAIKSALMTTATTENLRGGPIEDAYGDLATPFHYGGGHMRPSKAADPGLVYDAAYTDYLSFICTVNGTSLDRSFKCPKNPLSVSDLNYPSLAIANLKGSVMVKRTVTNVGSPKATYKLEVKAPTGYSVNITPPILTFKGVGEKQSFSISVKAENTKKSNVSTNEFGWYKWSDGNHVVTSPIVISAPPKKIANLVSSSTSYVSAA
ncbi:unnamed protein product [Cuscuta campestris]|uniref:Subtilisin-like protease fibronectin type-III domain-containing protein n=1 Tax=Cuscuta campestris TaxID=132261 RepID=A0A484MZ93_9ASTE|nr:unnamed protein product [Cuscuta campestris]